MKQLVICIVNIIEIYTTHSYLYLNYPTLLYFLVTIYRTILNIEGFTVVDEQENNFRLEFPRLESICWDDRHIFVIVAQ